jgi:hypothetical protein
LLSKKIGALSSLRPSYEPVGALTRLRINALTDRAAAEMLCAAAKAVDQACFTIAPLIASSPLLTENWRVPAYHLPTIA